MHSGPPHAPVLLYDGTCGFCLWIVAWILRWDRRKVFVPVELHSAEADRYLGDLSEAERTTRWHVVDRDNRLWSGGRAFSPVGNELPGGSVVARLAGWNPRLTDRVYGAVASRRALFGRAIWASAKRRARQQVQVRGGAAQVDGSHGCAVACGRDRGG